MDHRGQMKSNESLTFYICVVKEYNNSIVYMSSNFNCILAGERVQMDNFFYDSALTDHPVVTIYVYYLYILYITFIYILIIMLVYL